MPENLMMFSVNKSFVFESHPATVQIGAEQLCAWLQSRSGGDRIVVKWLSHKHLEVLSSEQYTAGPPQICVGQAGTWIVWESCSCDRWTVMGRRMHETEWEAERRIAENAFDPAVCVDSSGDVWCVYVDVSAGRRMLKLINLDEAEFCPIEVPTMEAPCYRPKLTAVGTDLWVTWEAYMDNCYRVCVCRVDDTNPGESEIVSDGPQWDIVHTACADERGRLWLAWVNSQDIEDDNGVIEQWQSIHAARLNDGTWERLPEVTDLCQGMLVNTGAGGYLGRRRYPMLVADDERVWVLWERKDVEDGHTRRAVGILCGKYFDGEKWSAELELYRGLLSYAVAPKATRGRAVFVARNMTAGAEWDSGVHNVYESAWGNLVLGEVELNENTREFHAPKGVGWNPVTLHERRPQLPRRHLQLGDEKLSLFWGDPHFHTAQTGDAEGEVDELLHYARHKARLDFCAICDNDVYCLPLTNHEWARQQRFIEEHSEPGEFIVVPSYEWSWANPETGKPNHRLILYAKTGEPIWRQVDSGGRDIDALAKSVEGTSGLLIGHHLGWVFAESDITPVYGGRGVEAAIEIVSAWSPHMVVNPQAIHDTLNTGRRLGFTGGSDSHRRNPGFCGALTGVYATELTAEALVQSICRRRTIATTGSMIALEFRIGDAFIGDDVSPSGTVPVTVRAWAPRPIKSLAVIRDGQIIKELEGVNDVEVTLEFDEQISSGDHWYYARAVLHGDVPNLPNNIVVAEGNHAWTSPIWVEGR